MKAPTITPIPPVAEIEAAERQVANLRRRRAELQANLEDLRDQQQNEMRRALGTGGTSPELQTIRAKVAEAEALVEQADQLIPDGDQLVKRLHAEVAAARSTEEKARIAAEVARLSGDIGQRLAALKSSLVTAGKIAGELLVSLGELDAIDGPACSLLMTAARCLDHEADLLAAGWKVGLLGFTVDPPEWWVRPLLVGVPGLDARSSGARIAGYLKARDAAAQAAPGVQR